MRHLFPIPPHSTRATALHVARRKVHHGEALTPGQHPTAQGCANRQLLAGQGQGTHHAPSVRLGEAQQPPTPSPPGLKPSRAGVSCLPPCLLQSSQPLPATAGSAQRDTELVSLSETSSSGWGQGRPVLGDPLMESKAQAGEAGLWHRARLCPGWPVPAPLLSGCWDRAALPRNGQDDVPCADREHKVTVGLARSRSMRK